MAIPKRLKRGGCGGRFCIFCWIERRRRARMIRDAQFIQECAKRRADFLADKIISGEWR